MLTSTSHGAALSVRRFRMSSQLRWNVLSGVTCAMLNAGLVAVTYPLYLRMLGFRTYGAWLVLSGILASVHVGNLGLTPAVTRLIARESACGRVDGIRTYLAAALITVLIFGLVVQASVIMLSPHIISWFRLESVEGAMLDRLLPVMCAIALIGFLVDTLAAALVGLNRADLASYAQSLSQLGSAALSVSLLYCGWGLWGLAAAALLTYCCLACLYSLLIRRSIGSLLPSVWPLRLAEYRELLATGVWLFGASALTLSFSAMNRAILSRFAGVAQVPVYDLAFTSGMRLRSLLDAGARSIAPEITRLSIARSQHPRESEQLTRNSRRMVLLSGAALYLPLAALAPFVLDWWLGAIMPVGLVTTFRILMIGSFASALCLPAYYTLLGAGRMRECCAAAAILVGVNLSVIALARWFFGSPDVTAVAAGASTGMLAMSLYVQWAAHGLHHRVPAKSTTSK